MPKMSKPLNGFIKLHRQMLNWEWYTNSNTFRVFVHLLLKANFKDTRWQGLEIKRGQTVTSLQSIANELGISVQNVRTALKNLQKTGEITTEPTSKFTLVTIVKWRDFQVDSEEDNTQINNQSTNDQQTTNNQLTINQQQRKNDKKDKNDKEGREAAQPPALTHSFGRFDNVILTDREFSELKAEYPTEFEEKIEHLSTYLAQSGKSYKNHFATLLSWLKADTAEKAQSSYSRYNSRYEDITPMSGTSYNIYELDKIDTLDDYA